MTTLLMRGGTIYTPTGTGARALAAEDGRVVYVGDDDGASAYEGADAVVDLQGGLAAPAFTDAHVHSVLTGFQLTRVDLRGTANLAEALDLVARQAATQPDGVVVATGWEEHSWPEGRPPTSAEVDRAAPGRLVLLERRDCHSSVVSPALEQAVAGLPTLDGYDASGRVERDARRRVSEVLGDLVGPEQRLVAARAAVRAMAASGIAGFHETAAPHIGPAYELELVRQASAETGLRPTFYWGSRDLAEARELRVSGLAGDLNADGAIGSRTAALSRDYDDDPGNRGHVFLTAEEIADHLVACTEAGLQGGFHCIGEEGLDTVAEGLLLARRRVGRDALRAARHRLEHVEMPPRRLLEVMAELGVVASMQPLFDALWGGPHAMYAERLGERWRGMNPVGSMGRLGIPMAFGSDSPVSPIDPWAGIRAAVHHQDPEERLDVRSAFDAHTRGGWYAARVDDAGALEPGHAAHIAVWDCPAGLAGDLPDLAPDTSLPVLRHLFVDGVMTGEPR